MQTNLHGNKELLSCYNSTCNHFQSQVFIFFGCHPRLSAVWYMHDPGQNWDGSPWGKSLSTWVQNPRSGSLHPTSEHFWLASMYALNECVFTISYVRKLKFVSCVIQVFYILAKFYLLDLSITEKVCWNVSLLLVGSWPFLQGCPLFLCTFWGGACLPLWFSVSSSFLSPGGLFCKLNCGFSKKFVMEGFSRYLVCHIMICLLDPSVPQP